MTFHDLTVSVPWVLPTTGPFAATVDRIAFTFSNEKGCHIFLRPHEGLARASLALALALALPGRQGILEEPTKLADGSAGEATPSPFGSSHLHKNVMGCIGRRHTRNNWFGELLGTAVR